MKKLLIISVLMAVVFILIIAPLNRTEAAEKEWKIAYTPLPGTAYNTYVKDVFPKRIEDATNGRLKINLLPSVINIRDLLDAVKEKRVDGAGILSVAYYGGQVPKWDISSLPGLILNEYKTMPKIINDFLLDEINKSIQNNKFLFSGNNMVVKNMVDEGFIVDVDKSQLDTVFTNLFTNSIKYSKNNRGKIEINAKKGSDDEIIVSVRDDGIGINSHEKKYIFDEFYKVDSSRHDLESSGLGLAICKRIVENLGGSIWVESPGRGKGSTFYFSLRCGGNSNWVRVFYL